VDCMRREELVRRKALAEREKHLAAMRADEREAQAAETRRRVAAKQAQEEENLEHWRKVEALRASKEEASGEMRAELAKQKAQEKAQARAARRERDDKMAALAVVRRTQKEAAEKQRATDAEKVLEAKEAAVKEKMRQKEESREVARVAAEQDFLRRLEKVWKKTEWDAAKFRDDFEKEKMGAEMLVSSFTEEKLERLKFKYDAALKRAAAAKQSYDDCLVRVKHGDKPWLKKNAEAETTR